MKIVVPVAGLGSRLKPHTFTVPKPLMEVAGKAIIDYVINDCLKLNPDEMIFVVGYKKESIQNYITKKYPKLNCSFVYQEVRDGDGSAIRLALEKVKGDDELFIIFGADTMVDFNYSSILKNKKNVESLIVGMEVDNPENYGIMNVDKNLEIYQVEEKPKNPKSNLAIIGAYYFKSLKKVKEHLNYFYENKITVKNEYKIVQVIEKYIENKKLSIKAIKTKMWFDCGRPEVLLAANRYFLEKKSNNKIKIRGKSVIIPPSFVAKTAKIENSVIGPYASIGEGVSVKDSVIKNSTISHDAKVQNLILKDSIVGREAVLFGRPSRINVGEKSEITLD